MQLHVCVCVCMKDLYVYTKYNYIMNNRSHDSHMISTYKSHDQAYDNALMRHGGGGRGRGNICLRRTDLDQRKR